MIRPPARWRALTLSLLLAAPGLATAQDAALPDASAPTIAPAADPPLPEPGAERRVPRLRIVAPDALRAVLERHLDLARAIALPEAATLGATEWSRLVAATPAQVRSLAEPLGLFHAEALVTREDGTPPVVTVSVEPGEPARVGRLTFEFQGELADLAEAADREARPLREALLAQWPVKPGERFSQAAWSDAKSAVVARLRAAGYATAAWAGTGAEVDPARTGVRLFVVADSGPLFRAGEVAIEGLVHHEAAKVRALAPFAQGEALTEARLLDYQDRLQKTGLFEGVSVSLDPDPARAASARVQVQLREAPRQAATVAVGYSANTGPRVTLEHVQRRLLDQPLSLRNKLLWGRAEQSWDGELSTHPDHSYRRWSLGGTLDHEIGSTDTVLSQRLRLGRSTDGGGMERFAYLEAERARECPDSSDCENLRALSFHLDQGLRRLDNALLPTRGYTAQLELGAGLASGDGHRRGPFGRVRGRVTGYWPLGASWYGEARLELGQVVMDHDVQAPDSQRFRAGGDDSVRGYAYRSLAPTRADGSLTGGRVLATASVELARPVSASLPSVWWAGFVDGGRAAETWQDFRPAMGYGLGLRWRSPVGPLKVDAAWGNETRAWRLHLSVGIAF